MKLQVETLSTYKYWKSWNTGRLLWKINKKRLHYFIAQGPPMSEYFFVSCLVMPKKECCCPSTSPCLLWKGNDVHRLFLGKGEKQGLCSPRCNCHLTQFLPFLLGCSQFPKPPPPWTPALCFSWLLGHPWWSFDVPANFAMPLLISVSPDILKPDVPSHLRTCFFSWVASVLL